MGTGFFVTDQYLLTDYHVIEDFEAYGAGEPVELNMDGSRISGRATLLACYDSRAQEEAYVVGYDSGLALLRLAGPTDKRAPLSLRAPTEDMVGAAVYAVGFSNLEDASGSWGKNDATVTSGTVSRLVTHPETGQRNVQIDCGIPRGGAGGPLIDTDGAVIGVTIRSDSQASFGCAVSVEEAISLLDQYRVAYTLYDDAAEPETTEPTGPVKEESPAAWIAAVVIGAVVVCGAAVALAMVRKKPEPAAPCAPPKVPVLRSCARINHGACVRVSGQPVMIGRNSACGLRFPKDAPGVSASHCTVQWDGECFLVMDLNSTYGTFLMNGQKMTPNVPYRLRPGDRFFLADQNNVIALELE